MKHYVFGEFIEQDRISSELAQEICETGFIKVRKLKEHSLSEIYDVLDKLQVLWSDPTYERRVRLKKVLQDELNFSEEMVELGLSRVALILNTEVLNKKVITELGDIPRNRGFKVQEHSPTLLQWQPLGLLFHVLAGNGFLGALSSLLEGLLTSNVNILKLAAGKTSFVHEFLESLAEVDTNNIIADKICALSIPSSEQDTLKTFKSYCDGVVVWGGEKAIQAYRNQLPARTRIIGFGPKLSFGIVTKAGVEKIGMKTIADRIALEISTWDQSACTAPQFIYVDQQIDHKKFIDVLGDSLEEISLELPAGSVDFQTAVEIQKWKSLALVEQSKDKGYLKASSNNLKYTLIYTEDMSPEPSPLHRTLRISPFETVDQVCDQIYKLNGYIQTVGVSCAASEAAEISQKLVNAGALRVLDLGKMSFGEVDDPHDGAYDLPQLMKLCHFRLDDMSGEVDINDYLPRKTRLEIINDKLTKLQQQIPKHTPEEYSRPLTNNLNLKNLNQAPIQKEPFNDFTQHSTGYVTKSSGSTGEPKFTVFSQQEWKVLLERSVRVFKAIGIKPGDRVANCLSAGDLYGGFVSFDHINSHLGTLNFNFTTTSDVESFVATWRKFKFNVIQGIPSFIIPLINQAKLIEPDFSFETLVYGGSPLSPSENEDLKTRFGVERISGVYGANDGGVLGFQCKYLQGSQYHIVEDYNYVEIESNNPGEPGKILVTALEKPHNPLIRYEVGDVGEIIDQPCQCGRTLPILNLMGRTSEFIDLNDSKRVHLSQLIEKFNNLEYGEFQLVDRDSDFELLLETHKTNQETKATQKRLREILAKEVRIKLVGIGSIPRKQRSTKVQPYVKRTNI